jgi:hypothetical protein
MQGQGQGNMHRIILALAFVALTATVAIARGSHGGPISGRALIIMVIFCLPIAFLVAICVWLDRDKVE